MAFLFGPVAGLMWIGAGRWAVAAMLALPVIYLGVLGIVYAGLPPVPMPPFPRLWFWLLSGLVSLFAIKPLARRFTPDKWYSHGLAVVLVSLLLIAAGAGVGLIVRSMLCQPFSVPSSSMEPTLRVGDYLWASKFAYGYTRFSFPLEVIPINGRTSSSVPERGDIVVFRHPKEPLLDYVKRVIGLPGDKIQMVRGHLHINGVATSVEQLGVYSNGDVHSARLQRETLPNGVSYEILDAVDGSFGDDTREYIVPQGQYFMMGDNRDNSADSRFDLGTVPVENLIGKVTRLFWSLPSDDYRRRQLP